MENKYLSKPDVISHLYKDHDCWLFQSNEEHSEGVAHLAAQFAGDFDMSSWGRMLGLLHDKGKERISFQQYIQNVSGYDPTLKATEEHNHAYVGGLLAQKLYGKMVDNLLSNPIASHHRGLYDTDELQALLKEKCIPQEVSDCQKETLQSPPFQSLQKCDYHHICRMLFSCLVDADYLDTESFMDAKCSSLRKGKNTLEELLPLLENYLSDLKAKAEDTNVNQIRNEVQERCIEEATSPQGFYSLTVPTGGGKTLSSIVWATRHAVHHGLKRIIIAIPYTSIIVQTANILRQIFGKENVLEHHCNVVAETDGENYTIIAQKAQLAMENWDYPIIVTTNVQLFESMFSNKPSICRKLHNIVKSVLILDEVQTLPTEHLQPIVDALKSYQKLFGVSVLLTTASQPILSGLIEGCNPMTKFTGIDHVKEIIPESFNLHDRLRRVQLCLDTTPCSYDEIAKRLCEHQRVLCIVNTRRDAKEIYKRLPDEGVTLHLSRMMCSDHLRQTIEEVKKALVNPSNNIIRVVSTQLVEAGVDIDFPIVFRQEAGLDSVLQAAGRCNREGKYALCTTHVFSLTKERPLPKGDMMDANNARKSLGTDKDWFAPSTMTNYFRQLYCRKSSFDIKGIKNLLYHPETVMFETAAKAFQLIEDGGISIIITWKNSNELINKLQHNGLSYALMKELSKYSVTVYYSDFEALKKTHAIREVIDGVFIADQQTQYDERLGLLVENQWEDKLLLI